MLTEELCDTKSTLAELTKDVIIYPQITESVKVKNKSVAVLDTEVAALEERLKAEIGPRGRLMIRESGTEPKIRIMAEAENVELCKMCVNSIIDLLHKRGYIDG